MVIAVPESWLIMQNIKKGSDTLLKYPKTKIPAIDQLIKEGKDFEQGNCLAS